MQYSESMPVMDAKAPYAVSPAAKIHTSASSPKSLSSPLFNSPSDTNHTNRANTASPPASTHRQVTSDNSYRDEPAQALSTNNSAAAPDREKRNFTDTPATRNSSATVQKAEPEIEKRLEREPEERPDYHIKIVCVGDGGCGKTCLMLTYTYGTFPTTYIPTVFENYLTVVREPNGKLIELALWDTAGQEEYDRLRVLSYPEVNIVLVCFALNSPASLDNVVDKWVPEISHFCPDIPFVLVGLKSDLRKTAANTGDTTPGATKSNVNISVDQAKVVASRVGANRYMECSARLSEGISEVFNTAVSIVLSEHLGLPPPPIVEVPGATPPATVNAPKKFSKLPKKETPKASKPAIVMSSSSAKKKKKKSKCVIL